MFHLTIRLPRPTTWPHLPGVRPAPAEPLPGRSPSLSTDQLPAFVTHCPVTMKYKALLGPLDWTHFPERPASRLWPGIVPDSRAPYAGAFLVKIDQGLTSLGRLRAFLADHPALVWLLGFPLAPCTQFPWGFDVQRSLPCPRQFSNILRTLPNSTLQYLLDQTVLRLRQTAPPNHLFGDEVSLDTKLILAWVKENNPKEYVPDRFNKHCQPKGDPDCKLGCKERSNQRRAQDGKAPATPTTEPQPADSLAVGIFYWGYGSGIVATRIPGVGEAVLAEFTQPFNAGETTYFFPLLQQVERRLDRRPRYGALDAAFDAFYVYDYFHEAGGLAAVPLAKRGKADLSFADDGSPLCQAGLPMVIKNTFVNRTGLVPQRQARFACPLLYPQPTGEPCPLHHGQSTHGGCCLTIGTSPGVRIRRQLDRNGAAFQRLYAQRTATERIFSQAKALGMERPKLRNQASIANLNTLTYVVINLRILQRLHDAPRHAI